MGIKMAALTGTILLAWGNGNPGPQNSKELAAAYTPAERQVFQEYQRLSRNVRSISDFKKLYDLGSTRSDKLTAPLQKHWDAWQNMMAQSKPGQKMPPQPSYAWADKVFRGFNTAIMAEGTMVVLEPDWKTLRGLAVQTPQRADDNYVALMQALYGESGNSYGNWMMQTWDYGGCSRIGSKRHSRFLQQMARQPKSILTPLVQLERKRLVSDLTTNRSYCHNKRLAMSEMQSLLRNFSWSSSEKRDLQKAFNALRGAQANAFMNMKLNG